MKTHKTHKTHLAIVLVLLLIAMAFPAAAQDIPDLTGRYDSSTLGCRFRVEQDGAAFRILFDGYEDPAIEAAMGEGFATRYAKGDLLFEGAVGERVPGLKKPAWRIKGRMHFRFSAKEKASSPGLADRIVETDGTFAPDRYAPAPDRRYDAFLGFRATLLEVRGGSVEEYYWPGGGWITANRIEGTASGKSHRRSRVVRLFDYPPAIHGALHINGEKLPPAPRRWLEENTPRLGEGEIPLIVYGHSLPDGGAFASSDGTISYRVIQRLEERSGDDSWDALWEYGTALVLGRLPRSDSDWRLTMGAALLAAKTGPSTLAGVKRFRWGELETEWALARGNATVAVSLRRPVRNEYEDSPVFFIPESIVVEARLSAPVDLETIPVAVLRNGAPVAFDGGPLLVRRVAPGSPLYRSAAMEVLAEGQQPPSPRALHLAARSGDTLHVEVRRTSGFASSASAAARVLLTPENLHMLWKGALKDAAGYAGLELSGDWEALSTKTAETYWNVSFFDIWLATSVDGNPVVIAVRKGLGAPVFPSTTQPVRLTEVKVGDHAAMILLRRMFVTMLNEHIEFFERFQPGEEIDSLAHLVTAVLPESHPLCRRPVVSVDNITFRNVTLRSFLAPAFLEAHFSPGDRQRVVRMTLRAALEGYLFPIKAALAHAEGTSEDDVAGLFTLTGAGFQRIADRVRPCLMSLSDGQGRPSRLWAPEMGARTYVDGLAYLAQLYHANEKVASADTDLALSVASLVPVLAPARLARPLLSAVLGTADIADLAMNRIPETLRNNDELEFARGAAELLDGGRLRDAESLTTSWWGTATAGVVSVLGLKFDIDDAVRAVTPGARARIEALVRRLKGVDGARAAREAAALPAERKADLISAVARADVRARSAAPLVDAVPSQMADSELFAFRNRLTEAAESASEVRPAELPGGAELPRPAASEVFVVDPEDEAVTEVVKSAVGRKPLPPGASFVSKPGVEYTVGRCISFTSAFSDVYELVDAAGKPLNKVLKIVKRASGDPSTTLQVLDRTLRGVRELENAGIPHLRIHPEDVVRDGLAHYFQERLVPKAGQLEVYFGEGAAKALKPEHQEAVARLYRRLGDAGLLWPDGHINNLYFEKIGGRWEACILDPDMIFPAAEGARNEYLSSLVRHLEFFPCIPDVGINSMVQRAADIDWNLFGRMGPGSARRLYRSPVVFMAKMLEHKGWITSVLDDDEIVSWASRRIDLETVEKYFPGFREWRSHDVVPPPLRN